MINVVNITKDNFQNEVINYKGKVILDFYADWCGACKVIKPSLEYLSKELTDVKFAYVNVDNNRELVSAFSIMSIPSLFVFEDGKITAKQVGALNIPQLKQLISNK